MDTNPELELELARRVQERTHPKIFPNLPGYEIFAKTIPATWGNGDFFDVIGVKPREGQPGFVTDRSGQVDHLVVSLGGASPFGAVKGPWASCPHVPYAGECPPKVISAPIGDAPSLGDATGHGMGAALMATAFTAMLRVSIRLGVHHRDLVSALNAQMLEDLSEGHFITLLLGRLDRTRNMFRWVSFGQGPIWLYRAASRSIEALEPHHPPLGVIPEMLDYQPTETFLEPGDTLLAISDGFPETSNDREELLGEQALMDVFQNVAESDPDVVFQAIWQRIQSHSGGGTPSDDRTFLLLRRLNPTFGARPPKGRMDFPAER